MANQKLGEYAFLGGVVIALLSAVAVWAKALDAIMGGWMSVLLVLLGIAVGYLNIGEKETQPFLVAAIALVVAGTAKFSALDIPALINIGALLNSVVAMLAVFVAPAAVVAAIKATWAMASGK